MRPLQKRGITIKKFKKTYIEITNACNMACKFCPKTKRKPAFMDIKMFESILKKISGHSHFLYFHVMGEPLMHPDIAKFLDLCDKYGFEVNLTTNGTLVNVLEKIAGKPALRQVNFSLHSHKNDKEYLDRIFKFVDDTRDTGLLIALRLWNHEEGKEGGNREMLERISARFFNGKELQDKPTHVRGIKISHNIFLNQSMEFEWPSLSNKEIGGRGACNGLRDQAAILVDGTVVPCCLDAEGVINLGNIMDGDLNSIIKSKRGRDFYNNFGRGIVVEELCRKCSYRQRFDKRITL